MEMPNEYCCLPLKYVRGLSQKNILYIIALQILTSAKTLHYRPFPVARRPSLPAPVLGVPAPPTLQAMPILGNRMIGAAFTAGETGTERKNSEVLI